MQINTFVSRRISSDPPWELPVPFNYDYWVTILIYIDFDSKLNQHALIAIQ